MAVMYFPFNSVMVNGSPDRAANAETLAQYLKTFFTDGVVLLQPNALQVYAKSGLTVEIKPGTAFLDGRILYSSAAEEFTLSAAGTLLHRIDRVIFRINYTNRLMEFDVLEGTPSSTPAPPDLTRNANVYEMSLAEIYVGAGEREIIQSNITDTRADSNACGIVTATVQQLDTSTFYIQYQEQFEKLINSLKEQSFEHAAMYYSDTMAAGSWKNKTYSFEAEYPFASYNLEIQPDGDRCTTDQIRAWADARIVGSRTTNIVKAYGVLPTIDIPIIIEAVKKE